MADLRKAVKLENPNKLADFDVSSLTVFRDVSHFHARQTEGPLEEDAELGNVGNSKKDALIVLVPSPSGMNLSFFWDKYGTFLPRKQSLPLRWMSQNGPPLTHRYTEDRCT